jgi:hypothetical protein
MKIINDRTEPTEGPAEAPRRPSRPRPSRRTSRSDRITEAIVANYVLAISTRGAL